MDLWLFFAVLYLIFNGSLQVYFVHWVLWRNKQLTMLVVDYYEKKKGNS
jgi:hypothetical protein